MDPVWPRFVSPFRILSSLVGVYPSGASLLLEMEHRRGVSVSVIVGSGSGLRSPLWTRASSNQRRLK